MSSVGKQTARPTGPPVDQLKATILQRVSAASDTLGRLELDEERRAEIHALLEAIRHGHQSDSAPMGTWLAHSAAAEDLACHVDVIAKAVGEIAQTYEHQARSAQDLMLRQQYERLARDQQRHAELAQRLLEIVSE